MEGGLYLDAFFLLRVDGSVTWEAYRWGVFKRLFSVVGARIKKIIYIF